MPIPMYNNYGYYPQNFMAQQVQQQAQQPMQIQNGGLISVRNEMEARNYPIASGTSITFKDENSPYVYTKTMGFSQLDRPTFEKFRLVKEENMDESVQNGSNSLQNNQAMDLSAYVLKADFDEFRRQFEAFKKGVKHYEQHDVDATVVEE